MLDCCTNLILRDTIEEADQIVIVEGKGDCIVCVVKVLFDVLPYPRCGVYPP